MRHLQVIFMRWLPFAVIATFMSAILFISIQQNLRLNANDPQIELVENAAMLLSRGQAPDIFGASASVDMEQSLLPFIIVYDLNGKIINGTGSLNGATPAPPIGVLVSSQRLGQNRLTWEPKPGVRIAAIVMPFKGKTSGYVLAGRSLREAEARINLIMMYVFIGWFSTMLATFVLVALQPVGRNEEDTLLS